MNETKWKPRPLDFAIGVAVCVLLVLVGYRSRKPSSWTDIVKLLPYKQQKTPCDPGLQLAVYKNLDKTLHGWNNVNAWIDEPSVQDLDKEQAEINRIKAWVKTLPNDCVKSEYNGWLDDYYQSGLNEAYDEVRNHTETKEMDQYNRDIAAEDRAADSLARKIPAPPIKGKKQVSGK